MSSTRPGELQISKHKLGTEISGKLLRPYAYETVGAMSLDTDGSAVAIKFFPRAGDKEFTEPLVVLLTEENIENFIRAIRIAQGGMVPLSKGGSS
jgi:hypothetical protein